MWIIVSFILISMTNIPRLFRFKDRQWAADASKIKHINIDLGGGEYIIEQSSDNHYFQIVAESSDTYQYYTENSTFYVIGFDNSSINFGDRHNKLTLRLPSDLEFY